MIRIAKSLLTILAVAVIAVGATGAYFADTETSTGNSFTAGTMDLKIDGQDDPLVAVIDVDDMKPGDTKTYFYNWSNTGSITGAPSIRFFDVVDNDNGLTEPEDDVDATGGDGEGELSQYLLMKLNAPGSTGYAYPNDPMCFAASGTGNECPVSVWDNYLSIGDAAPWEIWQTIAGGATNAPMVLEFSLPSSVDNVVQSDSVSFKVEFRLNQV